jgi:hypothetical protein
MASTFTPNVNLEEPARGNDAGTQGQRSQEVI